MIDDSTEFLVVSEFVPMTYLQPISDAHALLGEDPSGRGALASALMWQRLVACCHEAIHTRTCTLRTCNGCSDLTHSLVRLVAKIDCTICHGVVENAHSHQMDLLYFFTLLSCCLQVPRLHLGYQALHPHQGYHTPHR